MRVDITPYLDEYLGREITVVSHSNRTLSGRKGIVLMETKKTLVIRSDKNVIVPKQTGKFTLNFDGLPQVIDGDLILMRPEERIKNQKRIVKALRKEGKY